MASIEDGIKAQLESQVAALINKVFNSAEVPQNIQGDYCVYQRVGTQRFPTLTEQGSKQPTFQFSVYADTYDGMITLRDAVRGAFEDRVGQYTAGAPTVQVTNILNEFESYDDNIDRSVGILEITYFYN